MHIHKILFRNPIIGTLINTDVLAALLLPSSVKKCMSLKDSDINFTYMHMHYRNTHTAIHTHVCVLTQTHACFVNANYNVYSVYTWVVLVGTYMHDLGLDIT